MRFAVDIIIPPGAYRKIRDIQRELSKKYDIHRCMESRLGPHITLTHQPKVDCRDIKKMEGHVSNICGSIRPFNIRVRGIASFDKAKVVYATVLPDKEILYLNRELSSKLRRYGKVMHRQFKPHITLAFFDNIETFRHAQRQTKGRKLSFSFRLEKLSVAKARANGRLKVYKEFKLE
jgi:2'-5' RNA ligase